MQEVTVRGIIPTSYGGNLSRFFIFFYVSRFYLTLTLHL